MKQKVINGNVDLSKLCFKQLPDLSDVRVEGIFVCYNNQLTSLKGAPEYVGGYFYCSYNQLTSLKGTPEYVGSNFNCSYNQLTSLEGAPEYVGGHFYCYNNQVKFTEEDVRKVCKVEGNIYV